MKSIQEIFDLLIEKEFYTLDPAVEVNWQHRFMCHSLDSAMHRNLISKEEHEAASLAIEEYIEEVLGGSWEDSLLNTLVAAVDWYLIPSVGYEHCMIIFKDWENKPKLNQISEFIGRKIR